MLRILAIEDSTTNQALIQRVMRARQHTVLFTDNGEGALDLLAQDAAIDLILLDIELMGSLSGLDVIRALRARGDQRPVVALTAYAMPGDRERFLAAGCAHYLPKPVAIVDLLALLDAYQPAPPPEQAADHPHLTPDPDVPAPAVDLPSAPADRGRPSIALIVDADLSHQEFVARLLERAQLDIRRASTAQEALAIALSLPGKALRLAVLDIKLPDRDGADLLKPLRAWQPQALLVVATILDDAEVMARAFAGGCDIFMVKPHGFMELLEHLEQPLSTIHSAPSRLVIDQYGPRPYRG